MRKTIPIYVVAGVAIGIGALAWWRLTPEQPSDRGPLSPLVLKQQASTRPYSRSHSDLPMSEAISRAFAIDGALLREQAGLSARDMELLAERSSQLIGLYRSGTVDEFFAWLDSFSQKPYAGVWKDVDPQKEWDRLTATVHNASFQPSGIEITVRAHNGKVTQAPFQNVFLRSRSKLHPELDPLQRPITAIEIVIPMEMRNTAGGTFDGYLGVIFVKRPSDGEWVAHQVALYDIPARTPIPILPL